MKTSLQKRFASLASGLLIVGGIGVLGWLLWPREHFLLAQSTPLLYTTNWAPALVGLTGGFIFNFQHAWVSKRQLLYARKRPEADKEEAYEFVLHDLDTGDVTPLPGLRHCVRQFGGAVEDETLSPDHQWLLFRCRYGGSFVCRLDGNNFMDLGTWGPGHGAFWHGTQGHEIVRVGCNRISNRIERSTLSDVSHPEQKIPFSLHAAEAEMPDELRYGPPAVAITIFGKSLRLPFIATVNTASLSPSRDRIALELEGERTSFWQQWLHHFFPNTKMQSTSERSLWVLSLHDRGMQEIGRLPARLHPPDNEGEPYLKELQWLPDGRQLSYTVAGKLYTVAVN